MNIIRRTAAVNIIRRTAAVNIIRRTAAVNIIRRTAAVNPHERSSARGFTLLEVLVALAVFGLLIMGLTQGTRLGIAGLRAEARATDAQEELDAADRVLRRLIGSIDPGTQLKGPPVFNGERHRALFIAGLPTAPPGAGVATSGAVPALRAHVLILVDPRRRLVLRWYPFHETMLQPAAPQEAVLLADVARLDLSYWAATDGNGAWVQRWEPADRLPDLVRLHVVFPAGDRRHWPDIVASTDIGGPG